VSLPADDLSLALELADLADELSMRRYRAADLHVETKPDRTPVTEADRAVERALRHRLGQARPDDGVVGEELGVCAQSEAPRRWVIDPIDATASYLRGMPTWATLIALQLDGDSTVAVVSMPALGRRWWARRGGGAFVSEPGGERPLRVSRISSLADAQLAWSGPEDWEAVGRLERILALARSCWRTRGIGDAWQYMLVAEGAAEIALDPAVSLWDLAAPQLIVEEAGGRFTDFDGIARPDGGSGLASNGLVHDRALAMLRCGGHPRGRLEADHWQAGN
jgi:histidinol-phosphatase